MSDTVNQWRIFWAFVRSDRVITLRFFILVGVILLGVAAMVAAALIDVR